LDGKIDRVAAETKAEIVRWVIGLAIAQMALLVGLLLVGLLIKLS
jgi:hypothetical protein